MDRKKKRLGRAEVTVKGLRGPQPQAVATS